jgi:signal transduction histidine kinase/predicted negative regulator of RcsB-dependent stress response
MTRLPARFRTVHVIPAMAGGLVLLVSLTLGWLGWTLVAQEEALQEQQASHRLEQRADDLLTGFLRRVEEKKAWLSQLGLALPAHSLDPGQPGFGAVLVGFSRSGVQLEPPGHLLYFPELPAPRLPNPSLFAHAQELEVKAADLDSAVTALSALSESKEPGVRAEALLRMAGIEARRGRVSEALSAYARLSDETTMSPLEAPYGLLSGVARCDILASTGQGEAASREAAALVAGLESGRWTVTRESYRYYDQRLRKLLGTSQPPAPEAKLAIAEAVEQAWDEWLRFQASGSSSMTMPLRGSGPVATLAIVNANPERMISLIYAGDALRHLGFEALSNEEAGGVEASLSDEQRRPILGAAASTAPRATRTLSALDLPWELHVTDSRGGATSRWDGRNYLIAALVMVGLLVTLACYAMARGVLREAAAGRLQSDFVSAVSHEFRSPLTTLRQLTELLADGRIHEEGRRLRYFNVLQQESARLHQLVEDLLDFGRMDAGRRQYRIEPLDLSELVRDGIEEYQTMAGANGHRIEVSSDSSRLVVDADREAIGRVIRNLLENAVKYSPAATTVWVETGHDARSAVLRVRDEGIGIPPEEKARIFEKFVRGEAAKHACIPGTGIGLAMVKEILRAHHGDVDLASEVGRGSTFIVRLPLSSAWQGGAS